MKERRGAPGRLVGPGGDPGVPEVYLAVGLHRVDGVGEVLVGVAHPAVDAVRTPVTGEDRVVAGAAEELVFVVPPVHLVVPVATDQRVVPLVALQAVVAEPAGQVIVVPVAQEVVPARIAEQPVVAPGAPHAIVRPATAVVPGVDLVSYSEDDRHNYQYIVVDVDEGIARLSRDALVKVLWAENVVARWYFYPGTHRMELYRSLYTHAGMLLPVTEDLTGRLMTLPTGTSVGPDEIAKICEIIRLAVGRGPEIRRLLASRRIDGKAR